MHAFNPSTWEAEAGRFLSSRPAQSTEGVPGQPGLHRETLSGKKQKTNKQTNKKEKWSGQKDSIELGIRLVVVVLQEVKEKGRSTGIFHASPQDWTVSYQ